MARAAPDAAPCVSVIIPTYNRSETLRYAIASVLWQTFTDFELLVIGDACTDDSAAVVASFADPRVRWHNLERNAGNQWLPNNTGIAMARGRYIAYLGHDDLWLPDHLVRLVAAADAGADVAYALTEMVGPPGTDFRVLTGLSASGVYEKGMCFTVSCVLHTRETVRAIGGWRDYRTLEDAPDSDFLFRLWAAGKRFVPTNALTVIAFLTTWRRDAYRERRADEQAAYMRRIREEPDFLTREMLAIAASYIWERGIALPMPAHTDTLPRGWGLPHTRWLRGLEPEGPHDPSGGSGWEMRAQWQTGRDYRWFPWRDGRSAFVAGTAQADAPPSLGPGRAAPVETYEGYHDETPPHLIGGWARDSGHPDTSLTIRVYEDERLLGTVVADLPRQDLVDAGIGHGRYGFLFEAPEALRDGQPHAITLNIAGTDIALSGTPRVVVHAPPVAPGA